MIDGENQTSGPHSLFVNGRSVDSRIMVQEVVPFLLANYAIRPGRAHTPRVSAGGFGAAGALRHNNCGLVATIAARSTSGTRPATATRMSLTREIPLEDARPQWSDDFTSG